MIKLRYAILCEAANVAPGGKVNILGVPLDDGDIAAEWRRGGKRLTVLFSPLGEVYLHKFQVNEGRFQRCGDLHQPTENNVIQAFKWFAAD